MHIDPRALDDVHRHIHHGCARKHAFVHSRVDPVVRLDDGNPLAAGHLQASVARGAIALVGLVDHNHARIACLELAQDRERAILRAIVQADDLKLAVRLGKNAFQALDEVLLHVAHGNDDGNERASVGFHAERPFGDMAVGRTKERRRIRI